MRKTNIMKSLKIKNKTIKIKNINEVTGISDQVKQVGAPALGTIKNLALTAGTFAKFVIKTVLSPFTYVTISYWNETEPSFGEWCKNLKKNLNALDKNVEGLVKKYDENYMKMLRDIGLDEKEMNLLMFAGSPPLVISNMIYDLMNSRTSDSSYGTRGLSDKDNIIEKMTFLLTIFLTGENPANSNVDRIDVLYRKIKTNLNSYVKSIFGANTFQLLTKLHEDAYWKTHSAGITGQIKPIYSKINWKKASENPVGFTKELDGLSELDKNSLVGIAESVKNWCDKNINNKLNSSYVKRLNINTKIISEEVITNDQVDILSFSFAYFILKLKKNELIKLVLTTELGEGDKNKELKNLINDLVSMKKDKSFLIAHLCSIYGNYVVNEFVIQITKDMLDKQKNSGYDLKSATDSVKREIESKYINDIPRSIKPGLNNLSTELNNIAEKFKRIDPNKIAKEIKSILILLDEVNDMPEFNYEAYSKGTLFTNMRAAKLLTADEEKFWSVINGLDDIKQRRQKITDALDDAIEAAKSSS